jgi:uncharacterized membrane protein YfbV (UPF0208 family)
MHEVFYVALLPALALAAFALTIPVLWWMTRRDRRRLEVQLQLREMEQAIYEETLPEERREALRQYRAEQAEIRREARRRLGLPDEDGTA